MQRRKPQRNDVGPELWNQAGEKQNVRAERLWNTTVTASEQGNDFCLPDLLGPSPCPHLSHRRSRTAGERVSCRNGQHHCHALPPHQGTAILFVLHLGKNIPSKQVLFPQGYLQRTNRQPSTRSTYLGLWVQVCRISRDAELHRPRFYGNYSYRYSSQPGNTQDKSKFAFLLLHI